MNLTSQKKSNIYRKILLLLILVAVTIIFQLHQNFKSYKVISVDALCPFGALESLFTFITSGLFLKRIELSNFILLISVIVAAILFRRTFCGYICPLGTLQELFADLGKKIFKKHFTIPSKVDNILRYLKYVVLVLAIFLSYKLGILVLRLVGPWVAYSHITSSELFTELLIPFIVLVITLLGSMLFNRFFCKYLCPMGAFLAIISKIGIFKVKRDKTKCINCRKCDMVCPVNLKVSEMENVKSAECINCNLCVNACPVKDTLTISGFNKDIHTNQFMLFTILIFVVILGITTITKSFVWARPSIVKISETGSFDPALIKGSNTFNDISKASKIPLQNFMKEFGFKEEEKDLKLSELKNIYGFSVEQVREFVRNNMKK